MESVADGASIVLDYRREGCYAVDGRNALRARGNRRLVPSGEVLHVGHLLADHFLGCTVVAVICTTMRLGSV